MKKESLIAIIPARGGSKRIPHKNIVTFFGHPLLAYTVKSALNSNLFKKVIVSTDDHLIGRIAQWYGAEFLLRPPELADDNATLINVSLHLLKTLAEQEIKIDALCQLMPNCPLRINTDILEHYDLFEKNQRNFQISAINYRSVYPHWAIRCNSTSEGEWLFGEKHLVPSQYLGKVYCPTGSIWWVKAQDFKQQKAFYGQPFHLAPIDANRGIDIDSQEDLELADIVVRGLWSKYGVNPLEKINQEPFTE
ncbi:MAG: acylneuraminate cytidylyltransferase family protein [Cyanobacteria bacterium]|nr:acylneuraminate cytidylyltransferase family protein [Cyanobacteriota bacterium]